MEDTLIPFEIDLRYNGNGSAKAERAMQKDVDKIYKHMSDVAEKNSLKVSEKALRGFAKQSAKYAYDLQKMAAKGIKAGVADALDIKKALEFQSKMAARQLKAEHAVTTLRSKLEEDGLDKSKRKKILSQIKVHKKELKNIDKESKYRLSREGGKLKEAAFDKSTAKVFASDIGEGVGEAVSGALNSLKGGDLSGFFKTLGQGGKQVSEGLSQVSENAGGSATGTGRMVGQMGQLVGTLGRAAMLFGAVAGAVAGIVALLVDADSKAKEFNRTILDTVGAASFGTSNFDEIEETLGDMYTEASRFSRVMQSGMNAEQFSQTIAAFNQAGFTIGEMTEGLETAEARQNAFNRVTLQAAAYSRQFGISVTEAAEHQAALMDNLNMDFDTVGFGLSEVADAARESGFSANRFYSTIIQATSGMSMYNFRLAESADLLGQLSNVLGQDMAENMFQQLNEGFRNMSMQDRIVRVALTGTENMGRIFEGELEGQISDFANLLEQNRESILDVKDGGLADLAADFGLNIDTSSADAAAQGIVDAVSQLSGAEAAEFTTRLGAMDTALGRAATNLRETAAGAEGSMGDMAANMQQLGANSVLNQRLTEFQNMMGDSFEFGSTLGMTQRLTLEGANSFSPEDVDALNRMGERFQGQLSMIERAEREIAAGGDQTSTINELMSRLEASGMDTSRINFNELTGQFTDAQGREIQDLMGIIQAADQESLAAMSEQRNADLEASRRIAEATMSVSDILEAGVQYFLERIYTTLEGIFSFLRGIPMLGGEGPNSAGRLFDRRQQAMDELDARREPIMEAQREAARQLLDLQTQLDDATEADERFELQNQINAVSDQIEARDQEMNAIMEERNMLSSAMTSEEISGALLQSSTNAAASHQQDQQDAIVEQRERDAEIVEGFLGEYGAAAVRMAAGEDITTAASGMDNNVGAITRFATGQQGLGQTAMDYFGNTGLGRVGSVASDTMDHGLLGMTFGTADFVDSAVPILNPGDALLSSFGISDPRNQEGEPASRSRAPIGDALYELSETEESLAEQQQNEEDRRQREMIREQLDQTESQTADLLRGMEEQERMRLINEILSPTGLTGDARDAAMQQIMEGTFRPTSATEGQLSAMARLGLDTSQITSGVQDFIYRGGARGGVITPISSRDEFLGMQAGGAVATAGSTANNNININIYGGDPQEIYNTVRNVMERYNIRPSKIGTRA